jgi:hypothetical protein
VEEPDLREFDGEMGEEDEEGALPLFVGGWDFVLLSLASTVLIDLRERMYLLDLIPPEPRNSVDYNPRQRPTEVNEFVHAKRHDARGQNVVLHERVPREPHLLRVIERDVVFGNLLKGAPVCVLRHGHSHGGSVPVHHISILANNEPEGKSFDLHFVSLAITGATRSIVEITAKNPKGSLVCKGGRRRAAEIRKGAQVQ